MKEHFPVNTTLSEQDPSLPSDRVINPDEMVVENELYRQKVDYLAEALHEQTTAAIEEQIAAYVKAVGGPHEAGRINIWEAIKKQASSRARSTVGSLLLEEKAGIDKPRQDKDVCDMAMERVAIDKGGIAEINQTRTGPDVTDFNAGSSLKDILDSEELGSPEMLEKVTKTIRILVLYGIHKLNKWGNAEQLKTALDLIETYTVRIPDFNPSDAGFDELKGSLFASLSALYADKTTKPNYQYAYPEREYLFSQIEYCMSQTRRIEAHMYLRHNDFELQEV